jgi:hypothetical protein
MCRGWKDSQALLDNHTCFRRLHRTLLQARARAVIIKQTIQAAATPVRARQNCGWIVTR